MRIDEIEAWCHTSEAGTIGRTLLLPLSFPQYWIPAPLPDEMADFAPVRGGDALKTAKKVRERFGYPIAIGFVLLEAHDDAPVTHAFNVRGRCAIDVCLGDASPLGYWGYLPTGEQLPVDSRSLATEAPSSQDIRALKTAAA